jgi:hypothetical protein
MNTIEITKLLQEKILGNAVIYNKFKNYDDLICGMSHTLLNLIEHIIPDVQIGNSNILLIYFTDDGELLRADEIVAYFTDQLPLVKDVEWIDSHVLGVSINNDMLIQ